MYFREGVLSDHMMLMKLYEPYLTSHMLQEGNTRRQILENDFTNNNNGVDLSYWGNQFYFVFGCSEGVRGFPAKIK